MLAEQTVIYAVAFLFCAAIIYAYLRKLKKASQKVEAKIEVARQEGLHEPVSLHPVIDLSTCISSGACVAACPNASASLFTSAKITQFALLPQGHAERKSRARKMIDQMDREGFGNCSNHAECEAACPKNISIDNIAVMRREYMKALR